MTNTQKKILRFAELSILASILGISLGVTLTTSNYEASLFTRRQQERLAHAGIVSPKVLARKASRILKWKEVIAHFEYADKILHSAPSASLKPSAPEEMSSQTFPAFTKTTHPVMRVPNWGAMKSADEWNRLYKDMTDDDFVDVPTYDLRILTIPLRILLNPLRSENISAVTAKLYYSTRFFGAYDLDAEEFTAVHPGVDLKLPRGTPVTAIAEGRVIEILDDPLLGHAVFIEHHHPQEGKLVSIYGHLDDVMVKQGQDITTPGIVIGTVGMTGNTSGPHLHLQIDRVQGDGRHIPYWPTELPSKEEADKWVVNPIEFIELYRDGI